MTFTRQEQKIYNWGLQNGKSRQEVEGAIFKLRNGFVPTATEPVQEEKTSVVGAISSSFGKAFTQGREDIAQIAQEQSKKFDEVERSPFGLGIESPALVGQTLLRGAGATVKTAFAPLAEGLVAGVEAVSERISDIPEVQKFATNKHVSSALDSVISGMAKVGENYDEFKTNNPEEAKDIEASAEILLAVLGEEATKKILDTTVDVARQTISKAKNLSADIKLPDVSLPKVPEGIGQRVGAFKERVTTNVAEKQATEQAIKELPTETSQIAVRNGVDINDVKHVQSFFDDPITAQTNKGTFRELADTAKAYSEAGQRGTNPIEVVGKPVVERLQALEKERLSIGSKLGQVAEKELGSVTTKELVPVVVARLQGVSGLSGLKVGKNGILDFSNTTLASSLSKVDQKAIQSIFNEAVKGGTGKSKHLLRQELFEILGGKKSSLQNMTGTQEKAFEAVRRALSDVLETKSDSYKTLSNEYRKVIAPLKDGRKLLRENKIAGEENVDLLELRAGIIMRRLTGAGSSGPEIEALLRQLDAVGSELGGSAVSTRNLQEFYNILNKYYDLSPPTGFQGQIKDAIGSGGVAERVINFLTGTAKETPAVRQKALEDLLNELLKESL